MSNVFKDDILISGVEVTADCLISSDCRCFSHSFFVSLPLNCFLNAGGNIS